MADLSVKLPKPKYGQVVVLQKNGDEPRGHGFPLIASSCVVGRSTAADIRISSADVSLNHCKFIIDEVSGEASLEVLGIETEVNGTLVDPDTTIKLNHKDVVSVGGRKLRFEYLPPDYKPLPSKPKSGVSADSFIAEVVDLEENGDIVDITTEKEEEVLPEVQCTPASKRVSFGPYLSPEQFDNTLPPATPIKKGATPRRSTRYSGLKFSRSAIDPLVEEDLALESPLEEQSVIKSKECVDETIISEDADASVSNLASSGETAIVDSSPSLGIGAEFADLPNPTNLEMSMDAMSTMSDVSNIAAVPSECCSFLDEPIEEDEFGPEVVEQEEESLTPMGDTSLFSDDLIGVEIPVAAMTTSHLTNGTELLRSFTTSSLTEKMDEEDEEGITLSPEDMSEVKNGSSSINESSTRPEEGIQEVSVESKEIPSSLQADDVVVTKLPETPKLVSTTPKADSSKVGSVKQLIQSPKADDLLKSPKSVVDQLADDSTEDVAKVIEVTPAVVVERVEQVDILNSSADIEKVMETPESSPRKADETPEKETVKSPKIQVVQSPKADDTVSEVVETLLKNPKALPESPKLDSTNLEGIARLMETPKTTRSSVAALGRTPQADYTDVRGVKKLVQTPKPPPNTPKADYRDVRGVKRLLATPKAAPSTPVADYTDVEGIDLLMKTPKPEGAKSHEEDDKIEGSEKSPEKKVEVEESKPEAPMEIPETPKEIVGDEEGTPSLQKEVEQEKPEIDEKPISSPDKTVEIPSRKEAEESEKTATEEEPVQTSKRGRRSAATKTDYSNVSGVKRLLRTPKAAPHTPKADYSDVEGIDLLMKTPKSKEVVVSQNNEEEKHEIVSVSVPEDVVVESTFETSMKSEDSAKEINKDVVENAEKNVIIVPEVNQEEVKEAEVEKEATPPRRGRRAAAAAAKTPVTPKADYRDVTGVKRLLKTPKAASETPKADYTDVEGIDLLMETPKPLPETGKEEKDGEISEVLTEKLVEPSTPEIPLHSTETTVEAVEVSVIAASDVEQGKATVEEQTKETEAEKEVILPRRGRRAAAAKTPITPKADYRDVTGVKRLMKTPKAAPETPKADYTDVEGVDLLMKTPKTKDHVSPTSEKEKQEAIPEAVSETRVEESTPEASQESSETKEEIVNAVNEIAEESAPVEPQVDQVQPPVEEETEMKKEAIPPRRGRRPAAAKTPITPKADYRDVTGVKRLLKTPKAAPETPKADYTDVEGVDLLMKTPKANEPVSEKNIEDSIVPEESTECSVGAVEVAEVVKKEDPVAAAQVDEPIQAEETEEVEAPKEVIAPRRGRKPSAAKTNTPKADDREVKGTERQLQSSKEASSIPQADSHSEVEDVDETKTKDLQLESEEQVKVTVIAEESPEKPIEESTPSAIEINKSIEDVEKEDVKEPEIEKEVTPPRRGRRAAAPKTNTPKPTGRTKRKQPPSESDSQSESNGSADAPVLSTEKEEPVVEEESPVKAVPTPKRGRRAAAPPTKVETPLAAQSEEMESRPVRSKRRKEEQLSEKMILSPVVCLQRIDIPLEPSSPPPKEAKKVAKKRPSVSSGEEWTEEVKPVRRGRGRPAKVEEEKVEKVPVRTTTTRKGKLAPAAAAAVVEESIPSDEEVEDVEVKSVKKTTSRKAAVKRASIPEKEESVPEGKRRRGETAASKPVTGLDDVEMLHEGKGHAADIHANHMREECETNEESPATSSKRGRPTRGKMALKVHFDVAQSAPSPVRATRSARKTTTVSPTEKQTAVVIERDQDIDALVEEEDKTSATKRPRQKKMAAPAAVMADESPAVPVTKRTRGGKKTTSETEILKEEAPPSPRRTRRTRNN